MAQKLSLHVAALLGLGCACALSQQATPAPVQPGAPGEPSKVLSAVDARPAPHPPSEADIQFMQDMIMHHGQAVEMTELAKTRAQNTAVKEIASKIDLSQGDEIRWMKQWLTDRGIAPDTMGDMHGMPMTQPAMTATDGTPITHLGHENAAHTAHTNSGQQRLAAMNHEQMAGMDHTATDQAPTDHSDMPGMDHGAMAGMDHGAAPKRTDPMDTAPMVGMLTPRQMAALRAAHGAHFDELFLTGMMQHHKGALTMVHDLFQQPGAGQDPQLFDFANDVDNTQLAEIDIMKGILRKVNP